ncbi:MAG: hypothetical protein ACI8ZM_004140 [Crocinitomix sp.]|jgi:hypothetical protein
MLQKIRGRIISSKDKPDLIGAMASFLCLIHCMITPFIFVISACSKTCCSATPSWWKLIDYLFLIISFIAIYTATKRTDNKWILIGLWSSWTALLFLILNESYEWVSVNHTFVYLPAFALIIFHLYNKKSNQCNHLSCSH